MENLPVLLPSDSRAEDAARARLDLLVKVQTLLSRARSFPIGIEAFVEFCVPTVADVGYFGVIDPQGRLRTQAVSLSPALGSPCAETLFRELLPDHATPPASLEQAIRLSRSSRTRLDSPPGSLSHALGLASALCIPIRDPEGRKGAFVAFSSRLHRPGYDELDVSWAESLRLTFELQVEREIMRTWRELERQQADRRVRRQATLLAKVAHEIRNSLTPISGFSELLMSDGNMEAAARGDCTRTLHRNVEHLASFVNDLLDFTRVESGGFPCNPKEFAIDELVDEVAAAVRIQSNRKGVPVVTCISKGVPKTAHSDAGRIYQILMNLIGNALKFTETGSIVLRVECEKKAPLGDCLAFLVEDTGRGIAPDDQDSLFQPYQQVRLPTESDPEGSGLGLAISRELAQALGGELSLDTSEVGRGSTFGFRIPIFRRNP